MSNFFSCFSNGKGKLFYLDAVQRAKLPLNDPNQSPDSHSFIVEYMGKLGLLSRKNTTQDKLNAWEYNPFTKVLTCDAMNVKGDTKAVKKQLGNLDWKTIIPELNIKPIINPFEDFNRRKVSEKEIELLRQWGSVRGSVGDSFLGSILGSVGDSFLGSILGSVGGSIWGSIWDRIWDSVGDSIWGYTSSFLELEKWHGIDHKEGENPFQCMIDLWEAGLVPSFDGKTWRIHAGKNARVIFEISEDELTKDK